MLVQLIAILSLVLVASVLQKNFKIPSPLTIMSVVMGALYFKVDLFDVNAKEFDNLVLITIPILIAADALKLKWIDVKQHGLSLFWVAVISVLAFIGIGIISNDIILMGYELPLAAVSILFCMVAATDPITVSAVFSNFKVPHKLKVLTEGESLFNDATALIVFSIALVVLKNPDSVTASFIAITTFSVVFGAIAIGAVIGFITTFLLKVSDEAMVEATIMILSSYFSYWLAEHFHFSGILSVIVTILFANHKIHKFLNKDNDDIDQASKEHNFGLLKHAMTNKDNHENIIKNIDFISMFASAVLFVSIASIVDFDNLWKYRYEIIAVFIASTVIRGLTMLKFAVVSNNINGMENIKKHWWSVLTFAGSKGALSILMVHMIPSSFKYKIMFEHIIVGNIILSTFVYAIMLALIFYMNKDKFAKECLDEKH